MNYCSQIIKKNLSVYFASYDFYNNVKVNINIYNNKNFIPKLKKVVYRNKLFNIPADAKKIIFEKYGSKL